ncbi:MAG TPA: protein kinase [Myxococcales bacterium]|nr:protein kinase [Myxococcales bacterium]
MDAALYGGRYRVEEPVAGGPGDAFRARDLKIQRSVMLKLFAAQADDGADREQFERELRAAGALNHPNIVAVYDVGEDRGRRYIVTELLHGDTLRELLRKGTLPAERVLDFATQLASGLAAAHKRGIIHRHLSPEAVFVTKECSLKVTGFQLHGTSAGEDPKYRSPEQLRGEAADTRSDVFAAGMVLGEMLSGQSPPPASLPRVPLASIVERCLQSNPANRYPDCGKLLEDLVYLARTGKTRARARRRTLAITAGVLLAGIAALAFAVRRGNRHVPTTTDSDLLAVFPFTVTGSPGIAYLGDGMVDLLSATLASASIKTVDPHSLFGRLKRVRWHHDKEGAREVALHFRAKRFVLGNIAEAGSRVRVEASVYESGGGDAPIRQARTEGTPTQIFDLVDEITTQLLPASPEAAAGRLSQPVERAPRLAQLTTSSPIALAAYLEGLQEWRLGFGHAEKARAAFERAIAADPAFALAHAEMGFAATETGDRELAISEMKRAIELGSQLPERDRMVITGEHAFLTGKHPEAERLAREVLKSHPDDLAAQLLLNAELAFGSHLRGVPYAEASRAFERYVEMDPDQAKSLFIYELIVAGEFEKAERVAESELARNAFPDETARMWARWVEALLKRDRQTVAEILPRLHQLQPADPCGAGIFFRAARLIPGGLDAAEAVARSGLERNPCWGDYLVGLEGARGRWRAAREYRRGRSEKSHDRLELAGFSWLAIYGPVPREQLFEDLKAVEEFVPGPDPQPLDAYVRLLMLGQLAARVGDAAKAERAAAELERSNVGGTDSTLGADWAHWIRATIAMQAGRFHDAVAAFDRIRGEVPITVDWWWWSVGWAPVTYAHGEALMALGRYEDAERWFLVNTRLGPHTFVAPRLRRLGQIAQKRGDRQKAISYYERFVELWSGCDPELRPQVEDARMQLATLRR